MEYEQMELDLTLEIDRSLKDNTQKAVRFALAQIIENEHPQPVRNAHEGYGIAADYHTAFMAKVKSTKADMDTMLKLLPEGDGRIVDIAGSLYNSAVEAAVAAIKLAAHSQRIINDLYYKGDTQTPLEKMAEEITDTILADTDDDDFEEAEAEED